MSAWRVSKTHIDVLVQGAIEREALFDGVVVTPANASAVGSALWAENYRSVDYHYDEFEPTPEYVFEGEARVAPESLYKQLDCYNYQSCEHPGYDSSASRRFCDDLRAMILTELGLTKFQLCGGVVANASRTSVPGAPRYEAAPWGM